MSSYADREATQRTHYMAHMMQSSQPPRIRPIMIVIMVLSLGMFFIGLTMTIIAFWPGHSSIGQDPMEIAGPILLAVGGLIFIIGVVLMCQRQAKTRKHLERSIMASMHNSRSFDQTLSHAPSLDAKPHKSILKKTPSTSTYGTGRGSEVEDNDSGVANTFQTQSYTQSNMSYEPDSSGSSGKFEVYRIEALPDPLSARQSGKPQNSHVTPTKNGSLAGQPNLHSSTESEATVPTPVRSRTRERRSRSKQPSYSNEGYAADVGDVTPVVRSAQPMVHSDVMYEQPLATSEMKPSSQRREIRTYSNDGYDMFDPDNPTPQAQPAAAAMAAELDEAAEAKPRKSRRGDGTSGSGRRHKRKDGSGRRHRSRDGESGERKHQKKHTDPSAQGDGDLGHGAGGVHRDPAMGYHGVPPSPHNPVRINIKADPGTSVHIHSGAQPPAASAVHAYPDPQPPPNLNQTGSSIETEI